MPELTSHPCFLTPKRLQPEYPLFVFLPGMDGTGQLLRTQTAGLEVAFDVRCLMIPPNDLSSWDVLSDQVIDLIEEELKINQIVPKKLGGLESYGNLELLHQSCHLQHKILLEKYGGGKSLSRISAYFNRNHIEPNSQDGYRLMKKEIKKFKYQFV